MEIGKSINSSPNFWFHSEINDISEVTAILSEK